MSESRKEMAIEEYLLDIGNILKELDRNKIEQIVEVLKEARKKGRRVYVMGNGGSATTASHIAGDLNKTCGLQAISLTDSNYLITALANDISYGSIFGCQLNRLGRKGDIVIGISGSGLSSNIIEGLLDARRFGAITIGLTGNYGKYNGGGVAGNSDISIVVPSECMEQIEDIHLMIGHILVTELKGK